MPPFLSHCPCPYSITYYLHSFYTFPHCMLALGITCSPYSCESPLSKMQTYQNCCSANRTTVFPKGTQDKNLNWVYHTRYSIIFPLMSAQPQNSLYFYFSHTKWNLGPGLRDFNLHLFGIKACGVYIPNCSIPARKASPSLSWASIYIPWALS